MQLSESEIKDIEKEAEEKYPNLFPLKFPQEAKANIMGYNEGRSQGYVVGSTAERIKAKKLIEALTEILSLNQGFDETGKRYYTNIGFTAKTAINQYNNKP